MGVNMQMFDPGVTKPTVMVASHERSGTHFLLNSVSRAFGYMPVEQRLDLDATALPINFYAAQNVQGFFAQLQGHNVANLIKSHHDADFFAPVIEDVLKSVAILYIHRHPRDVMHSLWRFLKNIAWREGPASATPADLMRAPPEGGMLRYQMVQCETVLARWAHHVSGWHALARDYGSTHKGVHLVAYEDLRDDYAAVMKRLGADVIGEAPGDLTMPDKNTGVVVPQSMDGSSMPWADEDLAWIGAHAGDAMKALGYA